jgi:hypothetical protein
LAVAFFSFLDFYLSWGEEIFVAVLAASGYLGTVLGFSS